MSKTKPAQDIFISNALIINPSSPFNNKRVDILIENGIISKIGKNLKEVFGAAKIEGKSLSVSAGFADLHTNLQDPGFEYKETIGSGLDAAAAGGFTGILSCSTTDPCIDNKSAVEYQLKQSQGHLVELWPSGSISKKREGRELSEMYDMHMAGAKAFYDFKSNVHNSQLLKLALLYSKSFNGIIMLHPGEDFLSSGGQVNEGVMSTRNGLSGIPAIAEEIGIQRGLKLAEYTDHAIHFTTISTLGGIDLVKKAKKKGLKVTCGVSAANLMLSDDEVSGFDSNLKLNPPLRDNKTRKALVDALSKGVIDVVVSDHWPQNVENKECEFEEADFGMISLETAFALTRTASKEKIDLPELINILTEKPRNILNIPNPVIAEKEIANLTVFNANDQWDYNPTKTKSRSKNSIAFNALTGKVIATVNNRSLHINS